MRCQDIRVDDDAVSPVIGVVLMVAITVLLAAVVGVFVLGLNDTQQPSSAAFSVEENPSAGFVNFTHDGGDQLAQEELSVSGDVTVESTTFSTSRLRAGSTIQVEINTTTASSGDSVALVWNDPGSDDTQLLAETTLSKAGWDA
jgi:flagellin-like protein